MSYRLHLHTTVVGQRVEISLKHIYIYIYIYIIDVVLLSVLTDGGSSASAEMLHNTLRPNGHYTYHQLNIQQFHVLSTHCIYSID